MHDLLANLRIKKASLNTHLSQHTVQSLYCICGSALTNTHTTVHTANYQFFSVYNNGIRKWPGGHYGITW